MYDFLENLSFVFNLNNKKKNYHTCNENNNKKIIITFRTTEENLNHTRITFISMI